jgi:hypothetical protein
MHNNPSRPYTYYIVCPNGKRYYGYRSANKVSPEEDLWKHYFSSSKLVKELRKQYNDDALFVATVDKVFETDDEARAYEEEFLTENGCVKSDFWLNRAVYPKEFHAPEHHTEKTKKKMRKPKSDAHRKNMSIAQKGSNNPMYGKKGSKSPMYGKKHTEKHKENISKSQMGSKNHMYGKKQSEETIKKRTETRRKKRLEDPNYGIRKPAPKKNRI